MESSLRCKPSTLNERTQQHPANLSPRSLAHVSVSLYVDHVVSEMWYPSIQVNHPAVVSAAAGQVAAADASPNPGAAAVATAAVAVHFLAVNIGPDEVLHCHHLTWAYSLLCV